MVEPEMVFADLEKITNLAERLIKYVINYILDDDNNSELKYLENYDAENRKEIIGKLKKITGERFKKIDYSETIKILEKNKENFVFNEIK